MLDLRSCCLACLCLLFGVPAVARPASAQDATPALRAPAAIRTPPAGRAAVAAPASTVVSAVMPTGIEGDRADAIGRDIVLHPPQKQISKLEQASLRTATLKLGALLDRSVHGNENSEVGRVIDVLVADDGHPAALELDVGGFMGVGNRKIAVAWTLFDMSKPGNEPLRVALTEAQVRSAPAATESGEITVVTGVGGASPPAAAEVKPEPKLPAVTAPHPASPAAVGTPMAATPNLPALGLAMAPVVIPSLGAAPAQTAVPGSAAPGPAEAGDAAVDARSGRASGPEVKSDRAPAAVAPAQPPRDAASSAGRR